MKRDQRAYNRKYYLANREAIKARTKAYYYRPLTEAELAERRRQTCLRVAKYARTPKGILNSRKQVAKFKKTPKGIACVYRYENSPKGIARNFRAQSSPLRIASWYRYNHERRKGCTHASY